MVESVIEMLKGIPDELVIFIVSMMPILELRGGLVAASLLDVPLLLAFPICVLGNMLPIPFILLFLKKIFMFLKKIPGIKKVVCKLEEIGDKKGGKINKNRNWGLYALVAFPLPGTGAWTGALIATMLDIRMKRSFPIIFFGVITAGLIMSIVAYALPDLCMQLFGFSA